MGAAAEPYNVIALCAGYGGLERGLTRAGVAHRVVTYVEIEAFAVANLVSKMEAGELAPAPIWTNLKTFPVGLFRGVPNLLVTGGYPCQPFSHAGERRGGDDPRHLWPFISEIIGALQPERVFFENVEGHVSLGLNEVVADLALHGYATAWGIFSAREVGAPHQRKRVFIMGDVAGRRVGPGLRQNGSQLNGPQSAHASGNVPDAHDARQHTNERQGQARHDARGRGPLLADALGPGGPARIPGPERPDKKVTPKPEITNDESYRGGGRPGTGPWPVEPGLGRVVNGCPDRVDRLRLLGNGVVPEQAAKAWITLDEELTP